MPRYERDPDDARDEQWDRICDYLDTDRYKDDPDFHLSASDRYALERELERRARNKERREKNQ